MRPGATTGAFAGVAAAALAAGLGQLIAGAAGPQYSPVVAVAAAAIDLAPVPVREFAIRTFGSSDKNVLVTGVLIVLAALAALVGALAARKRRGSAAAVIVLTAVGAAAALTRPAAPPTAVVPSLAAGVAGAVAMAWLLRLAAGGAGRRGHQGPRASRGAASAAPSAPVVPLAPPLAPPDLPGRDGPPPGPSPPAGPVTGSAPDGSRRGFLVATGATLAVAAGATGAGRALAARFSVAPARAGLRFPVPAHPAGPLPPGTDLGIPGLTPFVTSDQAFYRVDTALILPEVAPAQWRLRVHGMVERELVISFGELLRRPLTETYITLTCVSDPVNGPYVGNARWLGASLADVLRAAGVKRGADQLLCTSADGFTSGTPVATVLDGRNALLAVAMNGTALPVVHGFPVRMVVPGLYGYVSATKWLTDIKVTTFAAEAAYWAQRGYARVAPIKTESRIDVPTGLGPVRRGPAKVAGVAWAQHTGIDAVEVQVDSGPWEAARLAAVPGIDTWRQWVWNWDAEPGIHTIQARATDATGYTQTAAQAGVIPNGATGYPSVTVRVT